MPSLDELLYERTQLNRKAHTKQLRAQAALQQKYTKNLSQKHLIFMLHFDFHILIPKQVLQKGALRFSVEAPRVAQIDEADGGKKEF